MDCNLSSLDKTVRGKVEETIQRESVFTNGFDPITQISWVGGLVGYL